MERAVGRNGEKKSKGKSTMGRRERGMIGTKSTYSHCGDFTIQEGEHHKVKKERHKVD